MSKDNSINNGKILREGYPSTNQAAATCPLAGTAAVAAIISADPLLANLEGDNDADIIGTGSGDNTVMCGASQDSLFGDEGGNTVSSGNGNDQLSDDSSFLYRQHWPTSTACKSPCRRGPVEGTQLSRPLPNTTSMYNFSTRKSLFLARDRPCWVTT